MPRKVKIVFVHHGRILGGAPVSLKNTLAALQKKGCYELKVLCAYPNMRPFFEAVDGVESDVISPSLLILGRVLIGWASILNPMTLAMTVRELFILPFTLFMQYKTLVRERPDIVHLNSSILYSTAIAAKFARIHVVWHVREILLGGRYSIRKKIAGWLIRTLADKVICISPVEAESLGKDKKKNIEVVFNFVDFSKLSYSGIDVLQERVKLSIGRNQKIVLSLGGLSFRKGTFEIIESAGYLPDNYVILIAGHGLENPGYKPAKRFVLNILLKLEDIFIGLRIKSIRSWSYHYRVWKGVYGKEEKVKFVGRKENVVPLLAISDIIVFAGMTPHFPRPVYEAWAMKKPVVVFDIHGICQNITNGQDGIIAKELTSKSLATAVMKVLVDSAKAEEMGYTGYAKSRDLFDADKNIGKIVEIYESLTGVMHSINV
jgi:glycosyltransferase involved in cell wall biosynthesis